MYLLDTNVISETTKPRPHGGVMSWLAAVPPSAVFLSSITIAELQRGAQRTRVADPAKAHRLEAWIDALVATHNWLPFDVEAARDWARILPKRTDPNVEDSMIAATARVHRLKVVTRNVKDFKMFDVPVFNPFESSAPRAY